MDKHHICATHDSYGNGCPNKATVDAITIVSEKRIHLCEPCFKLWKMKGKVKRFISQGVYDHGTE